MKQAFEMNNRLKKLLTNDRMTVDEGFYIAIKKDLEYLLKEYLDLVDGSLNLELNEGDGVYEINICADAKRIKNIRVIR